MLKIESTFSRRKTNLARRCRWLTTQQNFQQRPTLTWNIRSSFMTWKIQQPNLTPLWIMHICVYQWNDVIQFGCAQWFRLIGQWKPIKPPQLFEASLFITIYLRASAHKLVDFWWGQIVLIRFAFNLISMKYNNATIHRPLTRCPMNMVS